MNQQYPEGTDNTDRSSNCDIAGRGIYAVSDAALS